MIPHPTLPRQVTVHDKDVCGLDAGGATSACPDCRAEYDATHEHTKPRLWQHAPETQGLRTQDSGDSGDSGLIPSPEHCASESPESPSESSESPPVPDYLRAVWDAAQGRPLPAVAARYYLPPLRKLVQLCAELQIAAGTGTFFLACRHAAALIEVGFRVASKYLRKLEADGVLTRVDTGSRATHRANEYTYVADGSHGPVKPPAPPWAGELLQGDQDNHHGPYKEGY
jgi:hypothetical protein